MFQKTKNMVCERYLLSNMPIFGVYTLNFRGVRVHVNNENNDVEFAWPNSLGFPWFSGLHSIKPAAKAPENMLFEIQHAMGSYNPDF